MRRVQLAASRMFTKSKEAVLSPEASAAIVQLLKIASTINVPFCQTACNAIIAFIEMGEAAGTNDRQWQMLLDAIKIYACRISEFMEAISEGRPSDYLAISDDLRARIARGAVKDFETTIACTKSKVESRLRNGNVKKRVAATVIREEIVECRQMIATAHEQFNDRLLNILTISHSGAAITSGLLTPEEPKYDIPGARILGGHDLEILEDVEIATLVQDSFWTNLVRVEVHNKVRIAKIYSPSNGGKEKFKKDLKFLANHWVPRMVRIFGYNPHSQTPFVVFTFSSGRPIMEHWSNICHATEKLLRIDSTFVSLAAQTELVTEYLFGFVDRRSVEELTSIRMALRDATVDLNGKLIVAPLTHDSPADQSIRTPNNTNRKALAFHPRRGYSVFNKYRPFYTQDQLIRTWLADSEISGSLYQRWPLRGGAQLKGLSFPNASIGDIVKLDDDSLQGNINLTELAGSLRFYPPGKSTSRMHVYRYDDHDCCEEKSTVVKEPLSISWFCDVDSSRIRLDALHQLVDRVSGGEDYRRSPICEYAVVTAVQYFVEAEEFTSLSPLFRSRPHPNLYVYFSSQNEYSDARWSFCSDAPSELEASKEASLLNPSPYHKFSRMPRSYAVEYLCLSGADEHVLW